MFRAFSNRFHHTTKKRNKKLSVASALTGKTVGGCDENGACDFAFLQKNLNLQNDGKIEDFYEFDNKLGSGSFGVVVLARHKKTQQKRAVKQIIKKDFTLSEQKKLEREMDIVQQLSHPNILQLVEYFETNQKVLLVTDVYEGGELFDEIISRQEFSEFDAATVIKQLLSCVAYYNGRKIVHRDIKPENIMLEKSKDLNAIKLIDFGHATYFNPDRDKNMRKRYGTPYYMAPEVLSLNYDHKCDIWSVGVISYILLCGFPPFNGRSNAEIFNKIRNGTFSFEKSPWDTVSDTAKDFVSLLLTYKYKNRPEAKAALEHPFIKKAKKLRRQKTTKSVGLSKAEAAAEKKSRREEKKQMKLQRRQQSKLRGDALRNLWNFKCRTKLVHIVYTYIVNQFLTKEKREELAKVFHEWDKNHDGVLTRDEIKKAFWKQYKALAACIDFESLFEMIDIDNSGDIEYQEFLLAATDERVLMNTKNLNAVFDMIDKNSDEFITLDELRAIMKDPKDVTDLDLREMIATADTNGDGKISREEFMELLSH